QVIEAEFAWLCLEQPDGHGASLLVDCVFPDGTLRLSILTSRGPTVSLSFRPSPVSTKADHSPGTIPGTPRSHGRPGPFGRDCRGLCCSAYLRPTAPRQPADPGWWSMARYWRRR